MMQRSNYVNLYTYRNDSVLPKSLKTAKLRILSTEKNIMEMKRETVIAGLGTHI